MYQKVSQMHRSQWKKNKVNISNRIFEFNWVNVVDDGCNDRHLTLIEMIVFYLILIGEIRQERI